MESFSPQFDLGTEPGVQAYLAATQPHLVPCSLRLLTGGYVNHVWAVQVNGKSTLHGHRHFILKYYPPQAHGFPAAMPQSRARAEYAALLQAHQLAQTSPTRSWSVPEPLAFDPANNVVFMSEIRQATPLLDVLRDPQPRADLIRIGTALADFQREWTTVFTKDSARTWFVNDDMAAFHIPMRDFAQWAEVHALPNAATWLSRALGPHGFAHPNQTLIHGDFWPNSVLVHVPVADAQPVISLLDWEDHRLGHPGEDVAQMVANLFLMLHGKGFHVEAVKTVMGAFVQGVRATSLDLGDGFDAEAVCIKSVTSLIRFPHWGVEDVKAVVKKAAKGDVKQALGLM